MNSPIKKLTMELHDGRKFEVNLDSIIDIEFVRVGWESPTTEIYIHFSVKDFGVEKTNPSHHTLLLNGGEQR